MANFDQAIPKLLAIEGGYSDRRDDRGGETNWGITKKTAINHGYTGSMKDMPKETAIAIYKRGYWDALHLDFEPDQAVAEDLFQLGVNSGIGEAGIIEDRAKLLDPRVACLAIEQARLYVKIVEAHPDQKANFYGWIAGRLLKYI